VRVKSYRRLEQENISLRAEVEFYEKEIESLREQVSFYQTELDQVLLLLKKRGVSNE
jgi:predicted HTH domain antitoxin